MNLVNPKPTFKTFYLALSAEDRVRFAKRAATTVSYIETHLLYARKVPRKGTMESLWDACRDFGAGFNRTELLAFFYDAPVARGVGAA